MPESFKITGLECARTGEIQQLLARCPDIEPCRYREGELLIQEGEEGRDLFIVLKGAFTVEHPPLAPGGPPVMLAAIMCEDEPVIVGEMAYFGAQRRTASVRSSGASFALRLHPAHVDLIIGEFPLLTRIICQQFTRRLKETNEALRGFQERFALGAERTLVSSGEALFRRDEPASRVHQLLVGRVRLERNGESSHDETSIVGPEDLPSGFLEPGPFLRGQAQTATAIAEGDVLLATIEGARREAFVRCYPELALQFMKPAP